MKAKCLVLLFILAITVTTYAEDASDSMDAALSEMRASVLEMELSLSGLGLSCVPNETTGTKTTYCKDLGGITCNKKAQADPTGHVLPNSIDTNIRIQRDAIKSVQETVGPKIQKVIEKALRESPSLLTSARLAMGLTNFSKPADFQAISGCLTEFLIQTSGPIFLYNLPSIACIKSDPTGLSMQPDFLSISAQFSSDLRDLIKSSKDYERVEQTFVKTLALLIAEVEQKGGPQSKSIASRLKAIKFNINGCEPRPLTGALYQVNAAYDPEENQFSVCPGLLVKATSEFELVFTIAHELSHALGPCQLSAKDYPFSGMIECLTKSTSIKAPAPSGTQICENNFLIESIADVFASDVTSQYFFKYFPNLGATGFRQGYSNIFRSACDLSKPERNSYLYHPPIKDRINKILLRNPLIQKQMGCNGSTNGYCGLNE